MPFIWSSISTTAHTDDEAQENGQAAHAGDRTLCMQPLILGHVDCAQLAGKGFDNGRGQKTDHQRHHHRQQDHSDHIEFN